MPASVVLAGGVLSGGSAGILVEILRDLVWLSLQMRGIRSRRIGLRIVLSVSLRMLSHRQVCVISAVTSWILWTTTAEILAVTATVATVATAIAAIVVIVIVIVAVAIVAVVAGVVRTVTMMVATGVFRVVVTNLLAVRTVPGAVRILERLELVLTVDPMSAVAMLAVAMLAVARNGGVVVRRVVATIWSGIRTSYLAEVTAEKTADLLVSTVMGMRRAIRNLVVAVMI